MDFIEAQSKNYNYFEKFLPGVTRLFEGYVLIASKAETEKLYLVSKELYDVFKKMKKHPYSIGFFFAEIDKEPKFSFGVAERYSKLNKKKVTVNLFGEEKFLYKRNLMKKHIVSTTPDINKGDLVVVVNQKGDALGFGRALISYGEAQEGALIKNVLDRGFFVKH